MKEGINMKNGDFYMHCKNTEYFFDSIALPLKGNSHLTRRIKEGMTFCQSARYHENTHDLNLYNFDGVTFIDSDVPHVIYQSEKDYDTDKVWAREVDDFFGYKKEKNGQLVKRFTLKS
jgi:hypothetical protein